MYVRLLGTAAGGGVPQWNCNCAQCYGLRQGTLRVLPRTQSSVALSADGQCWFLLNASPDIRQQIEAFPPLTPLPGQMRASPIAALFLTDADLDHTLGLLILREGLQHTIYATAAVRQALTEGLALTSALRHYCAVDWREPSTELTPLLYADGSSSGLSYAACVVAGHAPLYLGKESAPQPGDRVGYRFVDEKSGGTLLYFPGLAQLEASVKELLPQCTALLLDGTFWSEHEMEETGTGKKSASQMGHLPVGGPQGSLAQIASLAIKHRIYVHINNTNPMLVEDSAEQGALHEVGVELGQDGREIII
ncbi:MAG TPA: pyrroloquinoline quinone biosynthesis protein PqqB [Ktedonobacteraceae bacterium]